MIQVLPYLLYGGLGVLGICGLFFLFEKPLFRAWSRWSMRRFKKRTGVDLDTCPNPFE